MEKLKKILENKKFGNINAQIKFVQDFDDFKIFVVDLNNSRDLSGKLTKDAIEFYGIDGDMSFETSETGVNELIEQINYEINCGYKISFENINNEPVSNLLFTSEDKIEQTDAEKICKEFASQNTEIASAHFNNFLNTVSYDFSFI